MIITPVPNGYMAFQRYAGTSKKVGCICEVDSIDDAIEATAEMIANHWKTTGDYPANILKVEVK